MIHDPCQDPLPFDSSVLRTRGLETKEKKKNSTSVNIK